MEQKVMSAIPGVEFYPIVSLVIFFTLFAIVTIWYFRADRAKLARIAQSPFEGERSLLDGERTLTENENH